MSGQRQRRSARHRSAHRPSRLSVSHPLLAAILVAALVVLGSVAVGPAAQASAIAYVQGAAQTTGSAVTSQTLTFSQPVTAGDLLVGWFGQYNAPGQLTVSDNVNGPWVRSVSEPFSSGAGDIALYFLPNSAAAPSGLVITVTATAATYLQSSTAEYSGVAASNPLDQAALNSGTGTGVDTGLTSAVPAGELVFSALTTGGSPGTVTAGSSQGVPYTTRASAGSGAVYAQDITSSAAGAQDGTATLGSPTDWYAVAATFLPASGVSGGGTGGSATFQQSAAFASGSKSTTSTLKLSRPVHAGDLLVGWFAQFNVPGQVTVSDSLNGAWTRAPNSLTFQSDTGDIALYYLANSQASASGLTITVSAPTPAYLQGTAAEYSGMAVAGPLDQIATARAVGVTVDTGPTSPVAAGELVYSAVLTGSAPGALTPGASNGLPYTARAQTPSGSSYEQDVLSAAAGAQDGTATLATSADWYAVGATFRVNPADTTAPGPPSALTSLSAASSRVALSWSPGSSDLTGYAITRNGHVIGSTASNQTTYLDTTVAAGTSYTYSVAAFDGSGLTSTPTSPVVVATPAFSPTFVQGTAASPGSRLPSLTLTLSQPVAAGDFLVGWFGQYNAPGQVQVSDNVNGAWTRGPSQTYTSGTGDIALEYVANTVAAPNGLTITVQASAPAYLQEAIAEFRGVATVNPLASAVVGYGSSTSVSMGPTASVPAGDLLIGATLTAGQPGSAVPGSSQGVPYVMDVANGSASSNLEDILATAPGPQTAAETLGSASTSYTIVAALTPGSAPSQAITFTGPGTGAVGGSASLSATGGPSGQPVVFSIDPSSGPGVCNVTGPNGSTLTYTAAGTCTVDANQGAGGGYQAAAQVQQSITVTPSSAPAMLAFTAQPGGGANGASWAGQPVISVEDAGGKVVAGDSSAVTLAITTQPPGNGAVLSCSANPVNASGGVASFAGCQIVGPSGTYTLTANDGSLTATSSSTFTVSVGAPTALAITTQPLGGTNGAPWAAQAVVIVEDSGGNLVTGTSSKVSLAIASQPGSGKLSCTSNPVATSNGAASFVGCKITGTAGSYTVRATDGLLSPATSASFLITPGPAAKVVFSVQPGGSASGGMWAVQPVVVVEDSSGNVVTSDSASKVTLTIASQPRKGGTLSCTANPVTATAGVATFAGCKITGTLGSYTLRATDGLLNTATSISFTA